MYSLRYKLALSKDKCRKRALAEECSYNKTNPWSQCNGVLKVLYVV